MKTLLLIMLLTVPMFGYSQSAIEHLSVEATEEHPGIPTAPIVHTVTHYFRVNENNVKVEAILNESDSIATTVVFKKGDKFALRFITYSYNSSLPDEESFSTDPYVSELSEEVKSIIFPGYNYDSIKLKSYYPVYTVNGVKYEFDLPVVDEEDIQRIYYPSVKITPDR